MFCVPKINKKETTISQDENLGNTTDSTEKSLETERLKPEKAIEKKILSENSNIDKVINPKKAAKNKKDPGAPKKPRSAFLLWSIDDRAKLKEQEEFCSLSFSDAGKELGKRWNDLNAEAKEVYEIRSKTEKMEYK